ncbi:uncharacterized protein LOC106058292 [Biomphalaria glabrata]|uniref:Uncharacterized protein LOC106058292 n=1 Tax=Biomphalaria glabrata TaxID=6526 RepID=A0A9U8E3I4_BIOGL|nr:uncharacterized protein LOC106058292 [Biomphalaria glabrata]
MICFLWCSVDSIHTVVYLITISRLGATLYFDISDKSKSKVCSTGLLEKQDIIHVQIFVPSVTVDATNETIFTLSAVNRKNSTVTKKLCEILFRSTCTANSQANCSCEYNDNQGYLFQFKDTAQSFYNKVNFAVNGMENTSFKLPRVYSREIVVLKLNMNRVPLISNCFVQSPPKSPVFVHLCTAGLNNPELLVSYQGINETRVSKNCILVAYCVSEEQSTIYIMYQDQCQRNVEISCLVRGSDPKKEVTSVPPEDSNQNGSMIVVPLIAALLLTVLAFVLIYYIYPMSKKKDKLQSDDDYLSVPPPTQLISTSVDPTPAPSPLKRLTLRLSVKTTSSDNNASKLKKDSVTPNGTAV